MTEKAQHTHTYIVSDLHLSESFCDKERPLWMMYKNPKFFIDQDFSNFLEHIEKKSPISKELILNGDIIDFDFVITLPEGRKPDWLDRYRGLHSKEWMSLFKIDIILKTHPVWIESVQKFLLNGNKAIFIIGNHDAELHWPSVQQKIREILHGTEGNVVFCNWFYISGNDTYVSHGNQYDSMCVIKDPINPLIVGLSGGSAKVRIPFGDLAGRYLVNGIGCMNPHNSDNYIMGAKEYVIFFFKYLKVQPTVAWSWLWGACATFVISLRDHWRPSMKDPLLVDEKIDDIAKRSNTTSSIVRKLAAMRVPSACANPLIIFRELWLDRAALFFLAFFFAWQIVLLLNMAVPISALWFLAIFAIMLPAFFTYLVKVKSKINDNKLLDEKRASYISKIVGTKRVVFAHTHNATEEQIGEVEYLNTGAWVPGFSEPECINRVGEPAYVWIRPDGDKRIASLHEWKLSF